jgi:hypothetical protein
VIVADTGALLAMIDTDHRHYEVLRSLWEANPAAWVVPWAVLPEVDYMLRARAGSRVARLFLQDVASGQFLVEHSTPGDLTRATALDAQYAQLGLGLVDGVVVAVAERLRAEAIATLDIRHFGALELPFKLYPRDL